MKKTSKLTKSTAKKLELTKQLVRPLETNELSAIVGGHPTTDFTQSRCITCSCWDC